MILLVHTLTGYGGGLSPSRLASLQMTALSTDGLHCSHGPLLRLHKLLERFREPRKTVHLYLLVYSTGYNSGAVKCIGRDA